MGQFGIVHVPDDAATATEAMGTKPKFWYVAPNNELWLFKQARPNTGEDWAEKFACEVASGLNIPHAHYELAEWRGLRGTVSRQFVPRGSTLIHGNEVLSALDKSYPAQHGAGRAFVRVREHTVSRVLAALRAVRLGHPDSWIPVAGVTSAADVFVGYLLLDALIGNTDRHHENWAWIFDPEAPVGRALRLAPSFDHASCLGRELTDDERTIRLSTRDRGRTAEAYSRRCLSGLYNNVRDRVPLGTLDAFARAAAILTGAAQTWVSQLRGFSIENMKGIADRLPKTVLSKSAAAFALRALEYNRSRLLNLHVGNEEDAR